MPDSDRTDTLQSFAESEKSCLLSPKRIIVNGQWLKEASGLDQTDFRMVGVCCGVLVLEIILDVCESKNNLKYMHPRR